ncbi:MAG: type I DNA topoisomerase [Myxococcota bacterium]
MLGDTPFMADSKKLVIVESPTKARTIRKFLGNSYRVEASMGHVRDLPANAAEIPAEVKKKPWARIGVDVENGFSPIYIIPAEKKKVVKELKAALKESDELYLATDEDREGESIGWHLVEVLKPKIPTRRMVFHEITREAIEEAVENSRELDSNLVQAQETRRVLDRLVGYEVSPLLWKKVKPKLSAGRVQSVAVRILVMRERERMAFVPARYSDLKALLEKSDAQFDAVLVSLDGKRLATGKDFDETTGQLAEDKENDVLLLLSDDARTLVEHLEGKPFVVHSVDKRQQTRTPYPPFTTSTLQQEANRKLGYGARRTMQIAQSLYQNGHITYMRTDSVHLSEEAIGAARNKIKAKYGAEYLSDEPKQFSTSSKGAQEAHEAIRPAGQEMKTVEEVGVSSDEAKLYKLIWQRTVATQMADAKLEFTVVKLHATTPEGKIAEFRASGKEVLFPGFFRAYVEGSDDPDEALEDQSSLLPVLKEADHAECKELEAIDHETKPPARYTEAALVKALEREGIGRPSTYASIIDTIQRRGYVIAKGKQLVPTFIGMAVTNLLEESLKKMVDLEFTAAMERQLDAIAEGENPLAYLTNFYRNELQPAVEEGITVDAREICTIESPKAKPYLIRVGRYGPYIEFEEEGEEKAKTVSLQMDLPPGDVDTEYLDRLIKRAKLNNTPLGEHPETGQTVFLMHGRFGHYLQLGEQIDPETKPKRTSIPKNIEPLDLDLATALRLFALPKTVGQHPQDGKVVKVGIGPYGPYVLHNRVYASLKPEDDVLEMTLPRALELIKEKLEKFGGQEPLKVVGDHPEDGKPIKVMKGRYGPYIKYKRVNASLPEGMEPEEVTMEKALELINARVQRKGGKAAANTDAEGTKKKKAAAKKAKTGGKKKTAAKKATKKKTTKKKAAAKKAKTTKAKASAKKKALSKKSASSKAADASGEADSSE